MGTSRRVLCGVLAVLVALSGLAFIVPGKLELAAGDVIIPNARGIRQEAMNIAAPINGSFALMPDGGLYYWGADYAMWPNHIDHGTNSIIFPPLRIMDDVKSFTLTGHMLPGPQMQVGYIGRLQLCLMKMEL